MTKKTDNEPFEQRVFRLTQQAKEGYGLKNDRYRMTCGSSCEGQEFTVTVHDLRTEELVAYSSMKADFEPSVREFVEDYFA